MMTKALKKLGLAAGMTMLAAPAMAAIDPETAYVFNTFLFLVCGFLIMFMAAGFAMLESGWCTDRKMSQRYALKTYLCIPLPV